MLAFVGKSLYTVGILGFRLLVSCIGIRASRLLFMERGARKVQSYFQNYIFLIILRFLVNMLMGYRILVVNLFLNFNPDD